MTQEVEKPESTVQSHLFTAREAAAFLRISERTLWKLTKEGRIKATRINRRVLYSFACLELFVDANTISADMDDEE
ncbi:helix-turn-helix domain-containing protein [bacterium]|nr:helix-turn-helix domain-containing protein [bacterium]